MIQALKTQQLRESPAFRTLLCNFAVAAFLFSNSSEVFAQHTKLKPSLVEMQQIRELIYVGKLDEALRGFEKISKEYPQSPAGDFYQIVTLIWQSRIDAKLDAGTRELDSRIETLLDAVNTKAEALRARPDRSMQEENDALYFLASAAATRARIALYQNHGLPAAKQARLAEDLFEDLIKRDPDYYDAYYAPAAIYYAV